VSYFSLGFLRETASLGFSVYATKDTHPNHRHIRYALFFHSLALIACIRNRLVPEDHHPIYLTQVNHNQAYIRKWLSCSPVNVSTWIAIVDAELASLLGSPAAFKLYDVAVKLSVTHDWLAEEGWCLFLQGAHYVRCGIEGLGLELQRRGIAKHAQWGAQGIVQHLSSLTGGRTQILSKKPIFSSDVAVQTETAALHFDSASYVLNKSEGHDDQEFTLSAADLASILKWSKDISSDINLSSALQRLTEIATETSGSQNTCVVIAREAGDYTVATSMIFPEPCQVHEYVLCFTYKPSPNYVVETRSLFAALTILYRRLLFSTR
jgi:hypothetical protein